ncbi:unnamed protein product [Staurois parvus]|uniref:Uncharacterized protein n=1 Tax=Staurois parvus TaxID=386267 RepID=A0ABN9B1T0_9NEOB|nr:unnamed protein product [Staurois parvus]
MPGDPMPAVQPDDSMSAPVPRGHASVDSEPTALPDDAGPTACQMTSVPAVEPNDLMPGDPRCPLSSQTIQCLTPVPAVITS